MPVGLHHHLYNKSMPTNLDLTHVYIILYNITSPENFFIKIYVYSEISRNDHQRKLNTSLRRPVCVISSLVNETSVKLATYLNEPV